MRPFLGVLCLSVFAYAQTAPNSKILSDGTILGEPDAPAARPNHIVSLSGTLTQPSTEAPLLIARRFVRGIAAEYELTGDEEQSIVLIREYQSAHNGVRHFVFEQRYNDFTVVGSTFTVNVDSEGRVLNAGGRLYKSPDEKVARPDADNGASSLRSGMRVISPDQATSFLPLGRSLAKGQKFMKFMRGGVGTEINGQPVWQPVSGKLQPAWIFFIQDESSPSIHRLVVHANSGKLLGRSDLMKKFQTPVAPRGLVFERESPQPNPTPGTQVASPRPYVQRTLQPFTGDPVASPRGWVATNQTVGNNTITGHNPLGSVLLNNPVPATAVNGEFSFPLELGPGAPNPTNYKDASTTNLFYWINRSHDLFYLSGFDEAAGNFQQDNFGRGGVDGDPVQAFSQFGIAANTEALIDNAFYINSIDGEDGSRISVNMLLGASRPNNVFTDGSYDAQVIVHEYGHGVSDRLVRDFRTLQGGAMGEAWSDFYALEFLTPEGAPVDGAYPVGEYLLQFFGTGFRSRPYSTNMDINPLTFAEYGRVWAGGPEVHFDGEIWVQALWEARAALIRQLGEKEGRRRIRLLVMDGMKLSPPSPTMIDVRDAILLADRTAFKGESQQQLWAAFAKRGMGVTAQSIGPDNVHVSATNDTPSNEGKLRLYNTNYLPFERVDIVLHDANNTSPTAAVTVATSTGDLEPVTLRKTGDIYRGSIQSYNDGFVAHRDSALDLVPNDVIGVYYADVNTGNGFKLIEAKATTSQNYSFSLRGNNQPFVTGREQAILPVLPGAGQQFFGNVRLTLPFSFPFYGKQYRTVFISGDGLLTFELPNYFGCNDSFAAANTVGIFPMWMELAYGGSGQPNENIYLSSGPDSVTIRWAAETLDTGEPVNASVVLFQDGRMYFQFGEGNINLVNSTSFGCQGTGPRIGLSNGHGTFSTNIGGFSGQVNLEGGPTILVDPPFNAGSDPKVILQSPTPNSVHKGVLTVRGIAYDEAGFITRLDVIIDRMARRMVRPTIRRTDFCSQQNVRGCPFVGFEIDLDLAAMGIGPGQHTIQVRGTNSRGLSYDFPDAPVTFTVEAGQGRLAFGAIETPASGATLRDTVAIRGYAYAPDLRVVAVDILIDGVTYGQASYGLPRADICGPLGNQPPNCPNIGFLFQLNTTGGVIQLPNGRHLLQARIRDSSGRHTLIPENPIEFTVENESGGQSPIGQITTPLPNAKLSGTVQLRGWAYDPDGQVRTIELLVDEGPYNATVRYGTESAAACASLTNVPACPNIGFEVDFDTRRIGNGLHAFAIRIRDNAGRTTIIPQTGGAGMNVTVEN